MHSAAQHEGVRQGCALHPGSAGRWPATSEATAEATAKAGYPWDGGVGPVAGDAVNPAPRSGPAAGGYAFGRLRSSASQAKRPHPCRLGRRLLVCAVLRTRQDRGWASCPTRPRHASGPCGSRPRNRTHPAFDRSPRSAVDPRQAWMNLCQITKSIGVRSVFQRKTDLTPRSHVVPGSVQPSPGNCRRRGGVGLRGVRGMDAAAKPPWTGLRRPRNPTPPRPTRRKPEPFLALVFAVAGQRPALPHRCRAQPCRPPSPAHENDFTDFSKPSSLRHASTILRSSMRPRATRAKNRPPIA